MIHIGIVGPVFLPSLNIKFEGDRKSWPNGMGGVPVNHEINALLELGFKVSVFSLSPEIDNLFEWHEENLSIYMGPYRKRAKHRCIDLFAKERRFLKEMLKKVQPEVIHAHWQYEWGWAALDSKIPTLLTCHDAPLNILKNQKDLYRVCRLIMASIVLKKAKNLTAVSPYTAVGLRWFTRKQISIIPNFEPQETFSFFFERYLGNTVKIAMVNNGFFGLKNVANGILAFKKFIKSNSAELHLFGTGHGVNDDAEKWCKKNDIVKNVFFHGPLHFDELIAALAKNDLLLHTSKEESCPMVIIEAMAMGIPTVAGDKSGGVPWVLKDGGGELVNIHCIDEIVNGIEKILSSTNYHSYSKQAYKVACSRFSKEIVMETYIKELESIVIK